MYILQNNKVFKHKEKNNSGKKKLANSKNFLTNRRVRYYRLLNTDEKLISIKLNVLAIS